MSRTNCVLFAGLIAAMLVEPASAQIDLTGTWRFVGRETEVPFMTWRGDVLLTQGPPVGSRHPLSGTVYWTGSGGSEPGVVWGWEDFQDGANGTQSYYNSATRRVRFQGYRVRGEGSTAWGYTLGITTYQADVTPNGLWMLNGTWGEPTIPGEWTAYRVTDCNSNGLVDALELQQGSAIDANGNGIIDTCETACTQPQIQIQPTSSTVCAGNPVSLFIAATGQPSPQFQWRRGGVSIAGETGDTLMIAQATPEDSQSYDVEVSNTCGSIISDAAVVVAWPTGSGDINGDGLRDGLDIDAFLNALFLSPTGPADLAYCAADMNADTRIDFADVPAFLAGLLGN